RHVATEARAALPGEANSPSPRLELQLHQDPFRLLPPDGPRAIAHALQRTFGVLPRLQTQLLTCSFHCVDEEPLQCAVGVLRQVTDVSELLQRCVRSRK